MATSLPTPNLIAKPFANDGTKNTIPTAATGTNAASLSEGFPLLTATLPENGGLPPKRADVNGMGYLATQPLYALQNGYLETFRADVSTAIGGYPSGARLWYQDSNGGLMLVKSLINNNTYNFNTNPSYIDGQKWTVDVQSIPSVAGQSGKFLSNNGTSAFWSKGVVGMVSPYAGTTAPEGWLICDGSAISRTTYSDLFSVIGTIYGAGDGSTTFNLPNFDNSRIGGVPDYGRGESVSNTTKTFTEDGFYIANTSRTQNKWPSQTFKIGSEEKISTYASTNDSAGKLSYQVLINKDRSYTFAGHGTGTFYPFIKNKLPSTYCIKY